MKIAIFTDTYLPDINGCARSVANLKNGLEKIGHEVYIICPNPKVYKFEVLNEYIFLPSLKSKWYNYRFSFPFSKNNFKSTLKKLNFDIIHLHTEFAMSILAKKFVKKLKIPLTYTFHTVWEDYSQDKANSIFYRFFYKKIYLISLRNSQFANALIVPSDKTYDYLKNNEKLNFEKIKDHVYLIPTGFDIDVYRDAKNKAIKENMLYKKTLKINPLHKVLLFLGRIAPEKNVIELCNWFLEFSKLHQNYTLIICGTGPDFELVKKFVNDNNLNNNVVLTGLVHPLEVQFIYAISDIFINPSMTETQGMTTLEALASTIPVILKDERIEYIKHQQTGYYYQNFQQFCEAILFLSNLIDTEPTTLRENCFESVKKFSHIQYATKCAEVYQKVIEKNKFQS